MVGAAISRPDRLPLSAVGQIVARGIEQIPAHYPNISIDKYVVMPDHIHMILCIHPPGNGRLIAAPTVSTLVGQLKRWVSKQIGHPIWQKSFYDHGIHNQRDYDEIWTYIENNPLK
jgi:REP element-mobilizing transposase RayT